ncbi:MAG: adenylosuccinate synthase [Gemmatales bacterium]|nr:adenylosuccinate synthase [Gemmatales bacterium]MDW8386106.1 adenylosuccinate synthase [Gemmatales bacterium]
MTACTSVVGLQWGDEAKGKIVDLLTPDHDLVVRYNGGPNAGHTVVCNGKSFKLSLIPTGILRPKVQAVIGNGVVVYPPRFLDECDGLRANGIEVGSNLLLSDRAHVILPYHLEEEALRESAEGRSIGTTGRGIGPCYQDKAGRHLAIRVGELLDADHLRHRLREIVPIKNRLLTALSPQAKTFDPDRLADEYIALGQALRPHVTDTVRLLHDAYAKGRRILFEAAQGTLLDVDHGTFPYVTSSNSSTTGIWSGCGFPARRLTRIVGVIKAYSTRVGQGPFPTELHDEIGEHIRQTGREYGTVTGRPRRCGWFDAVAVKHAVMVSGADELAIMLLDVLSELDEIRICVAYEYDGRQIEHFPAFAHQLEKCKPIYETLPGWKRDISGCRTLAELPAQARRYLDRLSAILGLPISIVSIGPDREQTIFCGCCD